MLNVQLTQSVWGLWQPHILIVSTQQWCYSTSLNEIQSKWISLKLSRTGLMYSFEVSHRVVTPHLWLSSTTVHCVQWFGFHLNGFYWNYLEQGSCTVLKSVIGLWPHTFDCLQHCTIAVLHMSMKFHLNGVKILKHKCTVLILVTQVQMRGHNPILYFKTVWFIQYLDPTF